MHPNPAYRKTPQDDNIAFARNRAFGVLAVNADGGPLISHIPFNLSADGASLEAHLVRSNPIVRLLGEPVEAVIVVSGGDAYVSPDWYGLDDQVPTWNYVAVHVRGTLRQLDQSELHGILQRLSDTMEERLADKAPWKIDKVDPDAYARLLRQIVPVAMTVTDIQGTWKLAQNKPEAARKGASAGIRAAGLGAETDEIARLMDLVIDE
ncbi:MAG: negative transcriptional regulator [Hyphomicrobiales bacterium]|nr:MAG: negative transcriptional regulator [Hyphomicrobiales bacterium]